MKKYFYSLLTMLTAVFALSSCEDVPAPYDIPEAGGSGNTGITPAGTGTLSDPFNVEGVIAFIEAGENLDSKVYIKGYVTSVKECSPSFGNATFYIASEPGGTNTFYVYRCNGLDNGKITSEDQIKEGDEVIVYGKVTDYNGTKETVQKEAYIYSINGEGGNGGGGNQGTPGEPKGAGTQADPYNATAANAFIATLGADTESANEIYVKGIVVEVKEPFSDYGNATFYIADSNESADKFYCFRALGLGNKQCKDANALKVGDEVIVCGKVVNYKGNTPETVQNKAYIYSLNGKTEGGSTTPEVTPGTPSGNGTIDTPFNVAAAVKKCKETGETATSDFYYVKGIAETVTTTGVETYGNITIDLVDAAGSTEKFKAYQVNSINGEKFTAATAAGIKKGDEIVVKGKLVNYKGDTPETTGKGEGCVVFVNGKTTIEPGTGGNTGGNTPGVSQEGTTVKLVNADANPGSETITCTLNTYGWTNASEPTEVTLDDGTKIIFAKGQSTNAPKYYDATKGVRMYAKNSLTIKGKKMIAYVVLECDSYQGTNYVGNPTMTVSFSGNDCVMVNEHTENSGGVQCRVKEIKIVYAQ